MDIGLAKFIPWIPAIAAVICGVCCTCKSWRKLAGPVAVAGVGLAFLMSVLIAPSAQAYHHGEHASGHITTLFTWLAVGGFQADMSYWVDHLTVVMLFVVTGVGTLVTIYATGYMAGDRGYARFFAGVSIFIFAMISLVMADNLVLLYLGWEGVGLASYLLIGFYYQKPAAVAAAKKAFIVNRIGDLGFALGIFGIYLTYGSVEYAAVLPAAEAMLGVIDPLHLEGAAAAAYASVSAASGTWALVIPFLLMLGAFGKSAQIPLYVWLPDAMEGPTPVSALIHAATMVTAGVYMIARLLPVFELSPAALPTVATVGAVTALFAATIALVQNDMKRVFAYSTISQLGYMFLGVGVLSTVSGVFHLFTHAFFKALLFLTAGSVMHALAGQLDIQKISGLGRKMPVTMWLMFFGCLALAGFPLTAGFFSKDMILAYTLEAGMGEHGSMLYVVLGVMGLVTAFLTAFYCFRVWFKTFLGPTEYEFGDEHGHGHDDGHDDGDEAIEHVHEAHEMPWLMNGPLVVLAVGSMLGGVLSFVGGTEGVKYGWIGGMIHGSSAAVAHHSSEKIYLLGMELHGALMLISGSLAVMGILTAAYFYWLDRRATAKLAQAYSGLVRILANKYYVDEVYDTLIVKPLRGLGQVFFVLDRLVIDGMVKLVGFVPRFLGMGIQPAQNGVLHGYGLGMAAGVVFVTLLVLLGLGWAAG